MSNDSDVRSALTNLMRLVAAIVADDHLSTAEVEFLAQWLDASKEISRVSPADVISRRVRAVMDDGVITTEEKEQLLAELKAYLEPIR